MTFFNVAIMEKIDGTIMIMVREKERKRRERKRKEREKKEGRKGEGEKGRKDKERELTQVSILKATPRHM